MRTYVGNNRKRILIFVREVGAVDNLSARQINGTAKSATNADLRKMSNMRLLDQKGKNKFTYYVPGERLIALIPNKNAQKAVLSAPPQVLSALPQKLSALPQNIQEQYVRIQERIESLPPRVNDKQVLSEIICDLCALCTMKLSELAQLVHRTEKYILRSFVKPLLRNKQIVYKEPDMINHPEQAYICKSQNKEYEDDTKFES
ncbi:hypothetical protein M2138_002050 [Dysgonomonadaceae bacterium PH5-43]|nr:hypothetical protein [Dysgonomonadaceae bacterium PH5-43]